MMHSCIDPSDSAQRLVVRGKVIDRVRALVQTTPSSLPIPETFGEMNQQIVEWHAEVSEFVAQLRAYPTGMPIDEALWRSLCFNGGYYHEPAPFKLGHSYQAWVCTFSHYLSLRLGSVDVEEKSSAIVYSQRHVLRGKS